MKKKITIESVTVKAILDTDPDTSWLGEYFDNPNSWDICRHCGRFVAEIESNHDCLKSNRHYNYFRPYAAGEKPGTDDYRRYAKQDFERFEQYNAGLWSFIGIKAVAAVSYETSTNGCRRLEIFESGGLWGIESDARYCHADVAKDEIEDLKSHLDAFGVDLSNWDELVKDIEIEY